MQLFQHRPQRVFLAVAKPLCSCTKHVEAKRFTPNSQVKTSEKTKGAQEWLKVTGRRVVALLLSRKLPQRLADGFYPRTSVPILVHKHPRCRLTHTTMTAWSTERVPRRDKTQIMKLKMLYTTKLWGVLHSNKRSCPRLRKFSSLLSSCFKGPSTRTSFEKNNSAGRQENFMFSSYSLWIQERGKNASHREALKNKPQYPNGKQDVFSKQREPSARSQSHFKEVLLCSSTATFFGSRCWKPEKVNHSEAFRAATRGLCATERVWTITGSLCYSIVIGSNPLKQRQEVDAKGTWRRLWEELLQKERFQVFLALGDKI